ncbi:hypothetical protein RN11_3754 [Mycobacterium tuberculosis]|nr:hypothetical protein RN11_3754 [Mycobacterium tuberculosis]
MSSPVSSRRLANLVKESLQGSVLGGVVSDAVLPAVSDDVKPGAGEDAYRVPVVVAAGSGAVVQVGGLEVGSAAVAGEVADTVAELFVCRPTEPDVGDFVGLAGGAGDAGQAGQQFGLGVGVRASRSALVGAWPCRRSARPGQPPDSAKLMMDITAVKRAGR